MLAHLFNFALKRRNGSAIVPLHWAPLFSLPLGDRTLTYLIVSAWCIERPRGGLLGNYSTPVSAFAAAWRMQP